MNPTDRLVLIVDDEPAVRSFLKLILDGQNIQSLEAETAVQALRIVRFAPARFSMVITDIQLPGDMDGLDLAYSLRRSFPSLPILLMSGHTQPATADFPFIRKPFRVETIVQALEVIKLR
jgi:DNA-binding NtrC family response regulator